MNTGHVAGFNCVHGGGQPRVADGGDLHTWSEQDHRDTGPKDGPHKAGLCPNVNGTYA